MKRLLFLLMLCIAFSSHGQGIISTPTKYKNLTATDTLGIPGGGKLRLFGGLVQYWDGTSWNNIGGGSGGTTPGGGSGSGTAILLSWGLQNGTFGMEVDSTKLPSFWRLYSILNGYLKLTDTAWTNTYTRALNRNNTYTFGNGLVNVNGFVQATPGIDIWNANRIHGHFIENTTPKNGYFLGFDSAFGIYRWMRPDSVIANSIDLSAYELLSNKSTTTTLGTSNTLYPTQNAVKTYVDNAVAAATTGVSSVYGRTGAVTAQSGDYSSFYPLLSGSYTNPSWITSLPWSKVSGTPTTLSAYGITDAQAALLGSGIVKSTAGTISYIADNSGNWNTAFGWGNHAAAGYLTNITGRVSAGTNMTRTGSGTVADPYVFNSTASGGGGSQNLQQVTDIGKVTTAHILTGGMSATGPGQDSAIVKVTQNYNSGNASFLKLTPYQLGSNGSPFTITYHRAGGVNPTPRNGDPDNYVYVLGTNQTETGAVADANRPGWRMEFEHNFQTLTEDSSMAGEQHLIFHTPTFRGVAGTDYRMTSWGVNHQANAAYMYHTGTRFWHQDMGGHQYQLLTADGAQTLSGDAPALQFTGMSNGVKTFLRFNGVDVLQGNKTSTGVSSFGIAPTTDTLYTGANYISLNQSSGTRRVTLAMQAGTFYIQPALNLGNDAGIRWSTPNADGSMPADGQQSFIFDKVISQGSATGTQSMKVRVNGADNYFAVVQAVGDNGGTSLRLTVNNTANRPTANLGANIHYNSDSSRVEIRRPDGTFRGLAWSGEAGGSGGTSYTFQHSLTNSSGTVNLVNDAATPGNSKYYGTNGSGTKGFYDLPSGGSSQWTTTGSDIYFNTGKVGIGTTPNSSYALAVGGNAILGNLTSTGTATPVLFNLGGTYGTGTAGSEANIKLAIYDDGAAKVGIGYSTSGMAFSGPTGALFKFHPGYTSSPKVVIGANGLMLGKDIAPGFPLDFGDNTANVKLALYNDGTTQYGFGLQGGEMRIFVGGSAANFNFYNGANGSQVFRIGGTGTMTLPTASSTPGNPATGSIVLWYDGTNFKYKKTDGTTGNIF